MLRKIPVYLLMMSLTVVLTGCASWWQQHNFIQKRRTEYLRSHEAVPLQVPAGLDNSDIGDDYIIPPAATTAPVKPIGLLPPDSLADKVARGVATEAAIKNAANFANAKPATVPAAAQTAAVASPPVTKGSSILPLRQPLTQAWNSVGAALQRAGYKIVLQDQNIATYYILDIHATDGMVTKATPVYQIKLQSTADGNAYTYVTDQNGQMVKAAIAQPILTTLSNALAGKGSATFTQMFVPVKR